MSSKRKRPTQSNNDKKTHSTHRPRKGGLEDDLFFEEDDATGMDPDLFEGNIPKKNSSDEDNEDTPSDDDENQFAGETAGERRIRLAKQVLAKYDLDHASSESDEESDDENSEDDDISRQLQQDVKRKKGKLTMDIAHEYVGANVLRNERYRGHRGTPTCITITSDGRKCFSGAKDASVIIWDVETGNKLNIFKCAKNLPRGEPGHRGEVHSIAVSSDNNYLATGSSDKSIQIWDLRTTQHVHTFYKHRDTVSGLAFKRLSHELYSASYDRMVNVFNIDTQPPSFVQTLYGHQDKITGIACLMNDKAVTCGMDKTVRMWKITNESQLLYNSNHTCSVDTVSMLTEEKFISGSQDGSLCCWKSDKKRAVHKISNAHSGKWITSTSSRSYTDLCSSGSNNGYIKLWKWGTSGKETNRLINIGDIEVYGYVNGISFSDENDIMVAAVGREHKFGRWDVMKDVIDGIQIIKLDRGNIINTTNDDEDEDEENDMMK